MPSSRGVAGELGGVSEVMGVEASEEVAGRNKKKKKAQGFGPFQCMLFC